MNHRGPSIIHVTSLSYTRSIKGDSVLYRGLPEITCARNYGAFEYLGKTVDPGSLETKI